MMKKSDIGYYIPQNVRKVKEILNTPDNLKNRRRMFTVQIDKKGNARVESFVLKIDEDVSYIFNVDRIFGHMAPIVPIGNYMVISESFVQDVGAFNGRGNMHSGIRYER